MVTDWLQLKRPVPEFYGDDATTFFLRAEMQRLAIFEYDEAKSHFVPARLVNVSTSNVPLVERDGITPTFAEQRGIS